MIEFFVENDQVLDKGAFQKQMLEKLIWIAAFMLVGARHQGVTVGAVEKDFRPEVELALAMILCLNIPIHIYCFFCLLF